MPGVEELHAIHLASGKDTGHLLRNLVLFGRFMKLSGLPVTPHRMITFFKSIKHIDISSREDFYLACRSVFVSRREDFDLFDAAFEFFWRHRTIVDLPPAELADAARDGKPLSLPPIPATPGATSAGRGLDRGQPDVAPDGPGRDAAGERPESAAALFTYSAAEALVKKDFEAFTWAEQHAARALMAQMHWRLGERITRRKKTSRRGVEVDMRATLRHGLRRGGEILELRRRRRTTRPRSVVLLCDISGSMETHTRLLLQFMHTIENSLSQVESFVFGTHLTRLTRQLRHKDIDTALREVMGATPDWSGGTRIGASLKTFNYVWARRVLRADSIVVIVSDGWDRGDIELFRAEIQRLQRSCHRLIWLDPHLGIKGYEPLTAGIQAALPFIDDYLPAHNLESLVALRDLLSHIGERDARRDLARRAA